MGTADLPQGHTSAWTRVVVGVDGSAGSLVAVRYAAVEAQRLGVPLELVHVVPAQSAVVADIDAAYPLTLAELRHVGLEILDRAASVAAETSGVPSVHKSLERGDRIGILRRCASTDHLLVLGNQRLPLTERLMTGAVLNPLAGRSAGPVIVVPDTWTVGRRRHGHVVVGVAQYDSSSGLLWRAFHEAAARGATLEILHAWELRIRYGKTDVDQDDIQSWRDIVLHAMHSDLASCAEEFPDVDHTVNTVHGQAAAALVGASRRADLVMLARRMNPLGHRHLGATGRTVLQATHCPVEVVAPAAEPVWERDAELERGGGLLTSLG